MPGPSPTRYRVAFISDERAPGPHLREQFDVVSATFEEAERDPLVLRCHAVIVDAIGAVRIEEVARIALGGTRGVLVIGAPGDPTGAMRYLDRGASDYVSSHATAAELLARIRAVARADAAGGGDDILIGSLAVSLRRREVTRRGDAIHLTPNEFALLEALARRAGELVSHRELAAAVWGPHRDESPQHLRLYVRQLREKLEDDPAAPVAIQNVWGAGYRLAVAAPAASDARTGDTSAARSSTA